MTYIQRNSLRMHLEQELASMRNTTLFSRLPLACPDENELASRLAEESLANTLYNRLQKRMAELQEAIRRLDVNDYGVCAVCSEEIEMLRLLAMPTVAFCVQCQTELESGA